MEFRVLGLVDAHAAGRPVDLGSAKQRLIVAILALEANRAVPAERLAELSWPNGAPPSARNAVQVRISRLRSLLARADAGRFGVELLTQDGAYMLRVDPARVDAHRFGVLVRQARDADDDERKVALLSAGLALWRGPALTGLVDDVIREQVCQGLEESRICALEERFEAELRLGRHRELIDRLTVAVQQHPFREQLVAGLVLALHRSGRTVDALRAYRRTKQRLLEEFGLEPGLRLRTLELEILRDNVAPLVAGTAATQSAAVRRNLRPVRFPARDPLLAGRARSDPAAQDETMPHQPRVIPE
jgi:DNA-binding SARP family transcriptional activator